MLSTTDDGGWETVANVQFQTIQQQAQTEEDPTAVPPPPEFTMSDTPMVQPVKEVEEEEEVVVIAEPENARPSRQYVYGTDDNKLAKPAAVRVVETLSKKSTHENVIEAEIRQQQFREESLREEAALRTRDKVGGASSPSSHASDEGFVDRTLDELSTPPSSVSPTPVAPQIYQATFNDDKTTIEKTSETKIAMEIRELREREDELRAMREIQLKRESLDEEFERASSSSRDLEDHMASITTTTDEGNFSEYGDAASTEDKSSDGFNSRIMSPDLPTFGEHRQRKITVKPYEDEDVDDQPPIYARMKKESVIEREIRLSKEREEAYRREKGLLAPVAIPAPKVTAPKVAHVDKNQMPPSVIEGKRGSQRISSSFIQQDIEASVKKEKELQNAGQIKTLSEDTVDSKVTRMADLTTDRKIHPVKSFISNTNRAKVTNETESVTSHRSVNCASPMSPFVPNFTPSPLSKMGAASRLTRSLSTNNLSTPHAANVQLRAPRGMMQKFIASRGKVTAPTFVSGVGGSTTALPSNPIITRPMTMQPKFQSMTSRVDPISRTKPEPNSVPRIYKRTHATAEEKIQGELREMKRREEELRRLRARSFGRSQPNLTGIGLEDDDSMDEDDGSSLCLLPELNGLKTALSNPNLLDDDSDRSSPAMSQAEKTVRRRSTLIAHWEDRIQQTADT